MPDPTMEMLKFNAAMSIHLTQELTTFFTRFFFILNAVGKREKSFPNEKEKSRILCRIEAKPRFCNDFKTFFTLQDSPDYFFFEFGTPFSLFPTNLG